MNVINALKLPSKELGITVLTYNAKMTMICANNAIGVYHIVILMT